MITTIRGFILSIEVGRAGLVTVTVILDDGSLATFVIRDLDADPERFNERLSMLGILRDAMNRAEVVEIEYQELDDNSREILRAVRVSRDALNPTTRLTIVTGVVLDIQVNSLNATSAQGEGHDFAAVYILTADFDVRRLVLDLQAPERLVADRQLKTLQDAYLRSALVRLTVDKRNAEEQIEGTAEPDGWIIAVSAAKDSSAFGGEQVTEVSGFVETLSLLRLQEEEDGALNICAIVRFTTAPDFSGSGNIVGLAPFAPQTVNLVIFKNSPTYDLFEAGLRDNLRMRVSILNPSQQPDQGTQPDTGTPPIVTEVQYKRVVNVFARRRATQPGEAVEDEQNYLCLAAELLAPLASASRPVWLKISRESLDHGPDGYPCTPGVPTSDLKPRSLRDLRIPYPAAWEGIGCFNSGVYRFQLQVPGECRILVDGEELCLHNSNEEGVRLAHACLCGEHAVAVEMEAWTCENDFVMDVYRLR